MPATATHNSHYGTYLGHLGQHDKKQKLSYLYHAAKVVAVTGTIMLTFANGNTALVDLFSEAVFLVVCDPSMDEL